MSRLIDADEAGRYLIHRFGVFGEPELADIIDALADFTEENKVEPKRGEWKTWEEQFPDKKVPKKNGLGVFCSACQLHADNMFNFCPNCGADMRENEKE